MAKRRHINFQRRVETLEIPGLSLHLDAPYQDRQTSPGRWRDADVAPKLAPRAPEKQPGTPCASHRAKIVGRGKDLNGATLRSGPRTSSPQRSHERRHGFTKTFPDIKFGPIVVVTTAGRFALSSPPLIVSQTRLAPGTFNPEERQSSARSLLLAGFPCPSGRSSRSRSIPPGRSAPCGICLAPACLSPSLVTQSDPSPVRLAANLVRRAK